MSDINNFYQQASYALMAYGLDYAAGTLNTTDQLKRLADAGLGRVRAAEISATNLSVVAQYSDASGASMTLFKNGSSYHLAIRGTEPSAADLTTDGLLALGQSMSSNSQFVSLKAKLLEWVNGAATAGDVNGEATQIAPLIPLGSEFTVTGHSLGGYLASGLKLAQEGDRKLFNISEAFLFNAPGLGGVVLGNLQDVYQAFFGYPAAGAGGVWNIQGQQGVSVTAGLGTQLTAPTLVFNENSNPIGNHSIVPITSTLGFMATLAELTGVTSVAALNQAINASGLNIGQVPEVALDCLRRLVLSSGEETTATSSENFDAFYQNMSSLVRSAEFQSLKTQGVQLLDLSTCTATQLVSWAQAETPQGLAVCQAMKALSPFALIGAGTESQGYASQPPEYWESRAAMLERLDWFAVRELKAYDPNYALTSESSTFEAESAAFFDGGTSLQVQKGALFNNTRITQFGSSRADTITGRGVTDTLFGGGGNDAIDGGGGADTLVGGLNDDSLTGGQGADTYVYLRGDGKDWLNARYTNEGAADTLRMDGINFAEVRVTHNNFDLHLEVGGSLAVVVNGWYQQSTDYRLKDVQFADQTLTTEALTNLGLTMYGTGNSDTVYATANWGNKVYAYNGNDTVYGLNGSDILYGGDGNDTLKGGYSDDKLYGDANNDNLEGEVGNDTLVGGLGADTLIGGKGVDQYLYSRGDGQDLISAYSSGEGAVDSLVFTDIASSEVVFTHNSFDLYIQMGNSRLVTVAGWYNLSADYRLKSIQFTDGTFTTEAITTFGLPIYGTSSSETLYATGYWDQTIYGYGGNDTIYGLNGNESIYGGDGNDVIRAWWGQDSLQGEVGTDQLYGEVGNDTLVGGVGNDYLSGGAGDDIFIFNYGDAQDTVVDESGYDTLVFTNLAIQDVRFRHSGSDLDVMVGDSVQTKIIGQYGSAPTVDLFTFGGQNFTADAIKQLAG